MVFSELFFLFFFFILCMALVYTRKTVRGQNAVLLVFSLLFRRKIHWMLCNVSFSAIWRALFVAPLFLTAKRSPATPQK